MHSEVAVAYTTMSNFVGFEWATVFNSRNLRTANAATMSGRVFVLDCCDNDTFIRGSYISMIQGWRGMHTMTCGESVATLSEALQLDFPPCPRNASQQNGRALLRSLPFPNTSHSIPLPICVHVVASKTDLVGPNVDST
jgi:hypothetical protein